MSWITNQTPFCETTGQDFDYSVILPFVWESRGEQKLYFLCSDINLLGMRAFTCFIGQHGALSWGKSGLNFLLGDDLCFSCWNHLCQVFYCTNALLH